MDGDTTGVEPDFALTKFKKLAGGGYFKIANQSLRPALKALGYATDKVDRILHYVIGQLSLNLPIPPTVLVMNADGSNVTALTDRPTSDSWPAWSPDGSRIAFVSAREPAGIYILTPAGPSPTHAPGTSAADAPAAWSADRSRRDG